MNASLKTFEVTVGNATIPVTEHEPGYLLGTVEICHVDHHVELIEVEIGPDGTQQPKLTDAAGDDLENYNNTRYENLGRFNDNEPFQAIDVDGREFVCVITPYA